jgi:hypothetical protein
MDFGVVGGLIVAGFDVFLQPLCNVANDFSMITFMKEHFFILNNSFSLLQSPQHHLQVPQILLFGLTKN